MSLDHGGASQRHEKPIVVGLGELLWDCFQMSRDSTGGGSSPMPPRRRPGGAPANVAFQAGQLGAEGIVVSRVGRDELGDELVTFLDHQGLSTRWIQRDHSHPTGTVTVDASQADRPSYVIHEDVAWDHLEFDATLASLVGRAAAVCFGTLAQRAPASREAIVQVLEATAPDCLIVYDVNLRQHWYDRTTAEQSLWAAKVVKLNAEEVSQLDRLLNLNCPDNRRFAGAIQKRFGVELVCVTLGKDGCELYGRNQAVQSPGAPVEVADAVGAGDAFTAALIVAHLRRWPLPRVALFANRVGALVAAHPGAMPPLRDEFARLMEEISSQG